MMIYKLGRSGAGCSGVQSSLHQNGLACRSSIFTSILNFFFRNGVRQHQSTSHCMPRKEIKKFLNLNHSTTYILVLLGLWIRVRTHTAGILSDGQYGQHLQLLTSTRYSLYTVYHLHLISIYTVFALQIKLFSIYSVYHLHSIHSTRFSISS